MTKQEILGKLKFDMEHRTRTKDTIRDYEMHVRLLIYRLVLVLLLIIMSIAILPLSRSVLIV